MPKNPFEAISEDRKEGMDMDTDMDMDMDNPVFGASQFASAMKKRNPLNSDSSETMPLVRGIFSLGPSDMPWVRRRGRRDEAKWFRHEYLYGSSMDRKTCIWSCDGDSWLDKSSGIMWVGVHGMDSICVVSRTGDLDIKRVRGSLKKHTIESFLHSFRTTVISEIEDLEDPSSELRGDLPHLNPPNKLRQGQCIKKPFGIVSVVTDEVDKESDHEDSYDEYEENRRVIRISEISKRMLASAGESIQALEYDEKKAIKYLRERMERGVAFTMDETIQAAISAFQHLLGKKFKANEIGVTVADTYYGLSELEAKNKRLINAKELEIHDMEKHLAVINEPGSAGSYSSVE